MKQMPAAEHFRRKLTGDWKGVYPPPPQLPPKPFHPDGDSLFRKLLDEHAHKLDNSAQVVDYTARSGYFHIGTGDATPDYDGKVGAVYLNRAAQTDPLYTISKEDNRKHLTVATYYRAPYGTKVPIGEHMIRQGYPMSAYSDNKMHIYIPPGHPATTHSRISNTAGEIVEVQNIRDERKNPLLNWLLSIFGFSAGYRCDGVKRYPLSLPSTHDTVEGSSAANIPLVEGELRYEYLDPQAPNTQDGLPFLQMSTFATPMNRAREYAWPATATDGRSTDPNSIKQGQVMRLTQSAYDSLIQATDYPFAHAVFTAWRDYGIMCVDTGGTTGFGVAPDARIDQSRFRAAVKGIKLDPATWEVWEFNS